MIRKETVQVSAEIFEETCQQVERSLDVVEITREIAALRFLVAALLDVETRKLVPTVVSLTESSRKIKKRKNKKNDHDLEFNLLGSIENLENFHLGNSTPFGNELYQEIGLDSPYMLQEVKKVNLESGSTFNQQIKVLVRLLTLENVRPWASYILLVSLLDIRDSQSKELDLLKRDSEIQQAKPLDKVQASIVQRNLKNKLQKADRGNIQQADYNHPNGLNNEIK